MIMDKKEKEAFIRAFIDTLIEERKKRNLSHEKLAQKAGLTRQAIGRLESDVSSPTLVTCYKLAKAMDLKLSGLMLKIEEKLG